MSNDEQRLPVFNPPEEATREPSCSPKVYVSNEEASLLAELRELREKSLEIRRKLAAADSADREELAKHLEALRERRSEVARRREAAFTRKMIMLGHLPPDYLV